MVIYKIVDTQTGDTYVGKTVKKAKDRFREHLRLLSQNKHHNIRLQRIYNKNPERLKLQILEEGMLHETALNERECYWIMMQGSLNITAGGEGGDTISNHPNKAEIIKKMQRPSPKGSNSPSYITLTQEQKTTLVETWSMLEIKSLKFLAEASGLSPYLCRRHLIEEGLYIKDKTNQTQKRMLEKGLLKGSRTPNLTEQQIEYIKKAYIEDWKSCKKIGAEMGFKSESTPLRVIKEAGLLRKQGEWTTHSNIERNKK
jgi:hypothetical protein